MRAPTLSLIHTLAAAAALLGAVPAQAQSPAAEASPTTVEAPASRAGALKGDQRIQHIVVEDSGSRVDEVRYGGQTQSVTVQPKGSRLPEYEVLSNDGTRSRPTARDEGTGPLGARVWNLFKF
ncbi:hypothetical protein PSQ20_09800 [Curvibacter sp. RS43]|uniref:DUF2782 domain-containing protein n=1 Tax=Curvibacter microcysteis TaxID=3026419 RepID=A0ABT5MGC3_9BURK|nr:MULTISPECIES: hypothetical protein [unclassified Curvibacter]MDD0810628.1 hypothetical protein [Curvibacter sp. RS43]MDD0815634.1 hypothetical protein [Curvibacter sp. HBC28]